MKKNLIILILLLILAGGIAYYLRHSVIITGTMPQPVVEITATTTPVADSSIKKCGFEVTSLVAGQKVNFPLRVQGKVDNSNIQQDGCSWVRFEGQAGVAQVYYNLNNQGWKLTGKMTPVPVENWMATSTNFAVILALSDDLPENTPIKIVFTEEDVVGEGKFDTLEIPLVFGSSEKMDLSVYIQDVVAAQGSDCGITKKVTVQVPKTTGVADASLRYLFANELSKYATYSSVRIEGSVAKVMLENDKTPSGYLISGLSSCQGRHLFAVLKDTLTQYENIKSVELYSDETGKMIQF